MTNSTDTSCASLAACRESDLGWELAVDTATLTQTIALAKDGHVLDQAYICLRGGHSRVLSGAVEGMLSRHKVKVGDLKRLYVGIGPGSFTGLRIGIAWVKGLGFSLGLPVVPVMSMYGVAAALPEGSTLLVAQDARKSEVYGTILTTGPKAAALVEIGAYAPEYLAEHFEGVGGHKIVCGDGLDAYPDAFHLQGETPRVPTFQGQSSAAGLLLWARATEQQPIAASAVEPRYMRASEAEISLAARLAAANENTT